MVPEGNSYGRWQLEPETSHIRNAMLRLLRLKSSEAKQLQRDANPNPKVNL